MTEISKDYSTDGNLVFCNGKAIPNSDPNTFTIPEDSIYFAYDKNQLYALSNSREGLQIWTDVDIESLIFFPPEIKYKDKKGADAFIHSSAYFADKNHLYYFNWYFIEFAQLFNSSKLKVELQTRKPNADAWWNWTAEYYQSLQPISNNIYTDGNRFFYHFKEGQNFDYPFLFGLQHHISYYSIIPNADKQTFVVLNDFYCKDNKTVFHLCRKINADLDTFEIINHNFAKDKNGIWYNGYFVNEDIDIITFEIVQLECGAFIYSVAKDKNNLFATQRSTRIGKYQGYSDLLVKLKNSDPETLIIFNEIWAKDKNNVYCYGKIWSAIDAQTFEFLFATEHGKASYVKDKNNLYNANGRRIIKGIDGKTFEMLNEYWGKDKNVVFNFKTERVIKSLDAETFIITGKNGEAEDKNYQFKFVPVTHNGIDLGHDELKKVKKK